MRVPVSNYSSRRWNFVFSVPSQSLRSPSLKDLKYSVLTRCAVLPALVVLFPCLRIEIPCFEAVRTRETQLRALQSDRGSAICRGTEIYFGCLSSSATQQLSHSTVQWIITIYEYKSLSTTDFTICITEILLYENLHAT